MNRDDIIRMAREACGDPAWDGGVDWVWGEVERFARLVAAAEREACETLFNDRMLASIKFNAEVAAFDAAIKAEREACAAICDKLGDEYADANPADCAFAIRERGAP